MKKLFTAALFTVMALVSSRAVAQTIIMTDTVHYFYNKYYFKTNTSFTAFPVYKSPAATNTGVAHVGVKFENKDSIDITGLEFLGARHPKTAHTAITTRMYLCNLDANGFPIINPVVDSITVIVTSTVSGVVGGQFANNAVHTMTNDFAVLFRNMSTTTFDTVNIMRSAGKTATNTAADPRHKMSDGFGFLRFGTNGGNWYHTTNFFRPNADSTQFREGFGKGTDYEFCLAPRVQYTLTAAHLTPAHGTSPGDPICTMDPMLFTNQSSKRFTHRQYNLIEFCRKWNQNPPFDQNTIHQGTVDVFPADSAITWYFAPEDGGCPGCDPRTFLPYNSISNQITFYTDSSQVSLLDDSVDSTECFFTNEFRARFKAMQKIGMGKTFSYTDTFYICTSYCNRNRAGLSNVSAFASVRVYPNPSTGKYTFNGLQSTTQVRVYDMLGNMVVSVALKPEQPQLDLTILPAGTYVVKMDSEQGTGIKRVVKQ